MCGVLGITIRDFKEEDCDLIRNLFLESMIRGKHATGVSYVKHDEVVTIKEAIPANEFIKKQDILGWRNEDGNLYCIGHVRYSTSDLRFNQPIATNKRSIVHNGVITQESPDTWEDIYGYQTDTANDSELILKAWEDNPLQVFHPSSMSVCSVDNDKILTAFRNEARPLWYSQWNNGIVFASTEDILKRSGLKDFVKVLMYEMFTVEDFKLSLENHMTDFVEDLQ
jgi:glutamine phosphoribosylpyrophosphate amidotransferase